MRRRSNGEAIEGAVQATILVPGSGGWFHPGSLSNSHNSKTMTASIAKYDTWQHYWSLAGSKYY